MNSKTLFLFTVLILVGCNVLTLYLYSAEPATEEIPSSFMSLNSKHFYPDSVFAFKYGSENIPRYKRKSQQTAQEYLKQNGLPTYEVKRNYGNFDLIKEHEQKKALDAHLKELLEPKAKQLTIDDAGDVKSQLVDDYSRNAALYKEMEKYKQEIADLKKKLEEKKTAERTDRTDQDNLKSQLDADSVDMDAVLDQNPYRKLGLYQTMPETYYNVGPGSRLYKKSMHYGIIKNPNYCEQVDLYNLLNPQNIFETMNFITDYAADEKLIRKQVLIPLGNDVVPKLSGVMNPNKYNIPMHILPLNATMLVFKRVNLHHFYEANKNMICNSQAYNHLPGHGVLTRKDLVVDSIKDYVLNYESRPKCVNEMHFPPAYRLNRKTECEKFFEEVNSQEFQDKKTTEPIQYIMKVGYGAHRARGLALLDDEEEADLKKTYANGAKCGSVKASLVAQKYVSNPLLLDKQNKFDFRIYMLVASVKPMIVYYHDGFLRLSLSKYDKFSKERNVHFTNTHLSKAIFADARKHKEYHGMTEDQLREYQMWTMEDLQDYVLKIGKTTNKNWLEEELKPKFKRSFDHIIRMTEEYFYKTPAVFELFGLDFVMDENLDIWFIECNASPQLIGTNERKEKFLVSMLTDMIEIQRAYLQSRMKRVFIFIKEMLEAADANPNIDYDKYKQEFDEKVNINQLDADYMISSNNSFSLIMDKNLDGPDAYFGHISPDCI